ncbi:MAG: (2Fe-2S)-binding protein [Spirochaetaceae bacterium]|nr:(2Fe-2S)-binding protein [Spirochaetaceae bacterium]
MRWKKPDGDAQRGGHRDIYYCLGITDKDIENAYLKGARARSWEQLQQATRIGTLCDGCKEKALELLHEFDHIYGT